ncbi:tryptophan-rich sensory protein [Acidisoma cellulosilytica]|uniref:Tryptophan-rich sensory protein n=1 Tax=Acidisoma cellulosilyticum TaxID=2802395 RepID=A0A963YXZ6_9PROT|nr:TspO/MBR family protein [Acidisoma cellulosilyticum]MCB8879307.1 tryptophan-rich sensory protein [Acidisoma cellulosilyticum]
MGLSLLVQVAASGVADHALTHWYLSLRRPPFTAPSHVFSLIWALADVSLGIAAWVLWRQMDPWRLSPRAALRLWAWEIALIALWAPVFFGLHSPGAGLVVMLLLIGTASATTYAFWYRHRFAGALLLPSLLWLCYGAYLNVGFWWLNPAFG